MHFIRLESRINIQWGWLHSHTSHSTFVKWRVSRNLCQCFAFCLINLEARKANENLFERGPSQRKIDHHLLFKQRGQLIKHV